MPDAPRAASFDSLRGFAALLIGIQLCAEILVFQVADYDVTSWPRVLVYDFSLTNAGIPIFFLISGYFIPASFPGPIRAFVVGRFFRLYPVFLAAGLLALALLPFENTAVGAYDILRSFVLMDPIAPATPFAHIHWMLMVLLGFYAICITVALLGQVHSRLYPKVAIALLLIALGGMIIVGHLYHRHFPIAVVLALMLAHLGWLTAQLRAERDPATSARQLWLLLLLTGAIMLICRFAWSTTWGAGELWIGKSAGYALAIALFVACAFGRLPTARVLTLFGALSYPLFFFLPLILSFAASQMMELPYQRRVLPLLAAVAAAFLLAALARRFIELPVAHWRRGRVP